MKISIVNQTPCTLTEVPDESPQSITNTIVHASSHSTIKPVQNSPDHQPPIEASSFSANQAKLSGSDSSTKNIHLVGESSASVQSESTDARLVVTNNVSKDATKVTQVLDTAPNIPRNEHSVLDDDSAIKKTTDELKATDDVSKIATEVTKVPDISPNIPRNEHSVLDDNSADNKTADEHAESINNEATPISTEVNNPPILVDSGKKSNSLNDQNGKDKEEGKRS